MTGEHLLHKTFAHLLFCKQFMEVKMNSSFAFSHLVQIATVDYPQIFKAIIFFVIGYCFLRIFKMLLRRGLKKKQSYQLQSENLLLVLLVFSFLQYS